MDYDREISEYIYRRFAKNKVQKAPARRISRLFVSVWSHHRSHKGARRAEERRRRKKERKKTMMTKLDSPPVSRFVTLATIDQLHVSTKEFN